MIPDDRPPFNVALFVLSQVIVVVATIPAFLPRFAKVLAVLFVGWITCHIVFAQTTGDSGGDQGIGSLLLAHYLAVIDNVLLSRADDLKARKDEKGAPIMERSLKCRVIWAMRLYTNPRGIGCVHEVPHIQNWPSPSMPRWKFVLNRAAYTALSLLALGVAYVVNAFNPGLTTPGKVLTDALFHWRALGVAGFAVAGVSTISAIHSALAALTVGCGFSSPGGWPYLFGSPLQAWSIKRFWRRVWHQMLRKLALTTTAACMKFLPLPDTRYGLVAHKFIRCCIVFFIGGIVHVGGDKMLTGRWSFMWSFMSFILQPLGIAVETLVCHFWSSCWLQPPTRKTADSMYRKTVPHGRGQANGPNPRRFIKENAIEKPDESAPPLWIRCVGHLWVVLWFIWAGAYFINPMCIMEMFTDHRITGLIA